MNQGARPAADDGPRRSGAGLGNLGFDFEVASLSFAILAMGGACCLPTPFSWKPNQIIVHATPEVV